MSCKKKPLCLPISPPIQAQDSPTPSAVILPAEDSTSPPAITAQPSVEKKIAEEASTAPPVQNPSLQQDPPSSSGLHYDGIVAWEESFLSELSSPFIEGYDRILSWGISSGSTDPPIASLRYEGVIDWERSLLRAFLKPFQESFAGIVAWGISSQSMTAKNKDPPAADRYDAVITVEKDFLQALASPFVAMFDSSISLGLSSEQLLGKNKDPPLSATSLKYEAIVAFEKACLEAITQPFVATYDNATAWELISKNLDLDNPTPGVLSARFGFEAVNAWKETCLHELSLPFAATRNCMDDQMRPSTALMYFEDVVAWEKSYLQDLHDSLMAGYAHIHALGSSSAAHGRLRLETVAALETTVLKTLQETLTQDYNGIIAWGKTPSLKDGFPFETIVALEKSNFQAFQISLRATYDGIHAWGSASAAHGSQKLKSIAAFGNSFAKALQEPFTAAYEDILSWGKAPPLKNDFPFETIDALENSSSRYLKKSISHIYEGIHAWGSATAAHGSQKLKSVAAFENSFAKALQESFIAAYEDILSWAKEPTAKYGFPFEAVISLQESARKALQTSFIKTHELIHAWGSSSALHGNSKFKSVAAFENSLAQALQEPFLAAYDDILSWGMAPAPDQSFPYETMLSFEQVATQSLQKSISISFEGIHAWGNASVLHGSLKLKSVIAMESALAEALEKGFLEDSKMIIAWGIAPSTPMDHPYGAIVHMEETVLQVLQKPILNAFDDALHWGTQAQSIIVNQIDSVAAPYGHIPVLEKSLASSLAAACRSSSDWLASRVQNKAPEIALTIESNLEEERAPSEPLSTASIGHGHHSILSSAMSILERIASPFIAIYHRIDPWGVSYQAISPKEEDRVKEEKATVLKKDVSSKKEEENLVALQAETASPDPKPSVLDSAEEKEVIAEEKILPQKDQANDILPMQDTITEEKKEQPEAPLEKSKVAKEETADPAPAENPTPPAIPAEKKWPATAGPYDPFLAINFFAYPPMPVEPPPPPQPHNRAPIPKRITLSHNEGTQCFNLGTNYTTLGILSGPDYKEGSILPLLDLRGHRFDNGSYASNIGLVFRYIPKPNSFCQMLGLNVYWDWREGCFGPFNQIGVGLEILGRRWDIRANGYIPVSNRTHVKTCVFNQYMGNYEIINSNFEFISYGFNAELGWLAIDTSSFLFYMAIGPYYLTGDCEQRIRGGRFRIRPQYQDYLALDVSVSYDSVFKTTYQAALIIYLPLYQIAYGKNTRGPCKFENRQIYQPVERFEIMPIERRCCWDSNF